MPAGIGQLIVNSPYQEPKRHWAVSRHPADVAGILVEKNR